MSFAMLTGIIDRHLSILSERRSDLLLVERNWFPLDLTFQPSVNDKGQSTLFCNCGSANTGTLLSGLRKATKLVKGWEGAGYLWFAAQVLLDGGASRVQVV